MSQIYEIRKCFPEFDIQYNVIDGVEIHTITDNYFKIVIQYKRLDKNTVHYYILDELLRIDSFNTYFDRYDDYIQLIRQNVEKLELLREYDPKIFYRDCFYEYSYYKDIYYLFPYFSDKNDYIYEKDQSNQTLIKCDRNYLDYIDCCNQALNTFTPVSAQKIFYYLNENNNQMIIYKGREILNKFILPPEYINLRNHVMYGPDSKNYNLAHEEFNSHQQRNNT